MLPRDNLEKAPFRVLDGFGEIRAVEGWCIKNVNQLRGKGFPYSEYLHEGEFPRELAIHFVRFERKPLPGAGGSRFAEYPVVHIYDYLTGSQIQSPDSGVRRSDGTVYLQALVDAWVYIVRHWGIEKFVEEMSARSILNG